MGKLVRNGIEYSGSGGGGGGSSVEITPSLVSGTKIADYEIDGTEGSLYAPTPQVIEANPAGTASSTLTKLGIDGDIYELAGGGSGDVEDVYVNGTSVLDSNKIAQITSYKEITQAQYDALPATKESDGILYCIKDAVSTGGGGIENDTLYTNSGTSLESTITLTNAYTDYDFLIFRTIRLADNQIYYIDKIFNTKDLSTNDYLQILIWYSTNYYTYQITSSTTLSLTNSGTYCYLYKIYGVKVLSGGERGSSSHNYSTDEQVIGTWIDGSTLYEQTFNLAGQYSVPSSGWGTTNITYNDYFNIIVGVEAVCQDSSSYYYIPCSATKASTTGKLLVAGVTANQGRAIQYLTVRYTKPTS